MFVIGKQGNLTLKYRSKVGDASEVLGELLAGHSNKEVRAILAHAILGVSNGKRKV